MIQYNKIWFILLIFQVVQVLNVLNNYLCSCLEHGWTSCQTFCTACQSMFFLPTRVIVVIIIIINLTANTDLCMLVLIDKDVEQNYQVHFTTSKSVSDWMRILLIIMGYNCLLLNCNIRSSNTYCIPSPMSGDKTGSLLLLGIANRFLGLSWGNPDFLGTQWRSPILIIAYIHFRFCNSLMLPNSTLSFNIFLTGLEFGCHSWKS